MEKATSIDEYIAGFPEPVQMMMEQIRETIKSVAPEATEAISYAIPAFNLNGRYFIYFAGFKNHIGMYPVPNGVPELEKDYAGYKTSGKGTIQFPLNRPLPLDLIARIAQHRVMLNEQKAAEKKQKKARS